MSSFPLPTTPLNEHSLISLETWLLDLGAVKSNQDPTQWAIFNPQWSAEIKMCVDELQVVWKKDGRISSCSFPYGLSRSDVEVAIIAGP